MIGIIGAMDEEIAHLKEIIDIKNEKQVLDVVFYEGTLNSKEVILVKSKIGKVAASFVATLLISNYKLDYVINIGTCGAISSKLKYLDIVASDKVLYHDVDVRAFGYDYGQMAQAGKYFQASDYLIERCKKMGNVIVGDMLCGDEFVNDKDKMLKKVAEHFTRYNPLTVDMESCAIAHTLTLANVDFIIIRTISDVLDFDGDKRDFASLALESCKLLANFIKEFTNA